MTATVGSERARNPVDAVMRDIFVPLCFGGTICIPEKREIILDAGQLGNWIEEAKVTVVHCTPTLFRLIDEAREGRERYPELQYVLMAGERIQPGTLKGWYEKEGERIQLVNLYGPSETTMVKTWYEIMPADVNKKNIPIGKPMDGAAVHIMNQAYQECDAGEEGEIWIETRYMTLGYYRNEELSGKSFLTVPAEGDSLRRLYRTGDYGRVLPDGNLEYLGRKDRQVKIRGNRIELAGIEEVLLSYPGIREGLIHVEDEEEARHCCLCGLTSQYDGVSIGEDGICNVCNEYKEYQGLTDEYFRTIDELAPKLKQTPGSQYDCILLYSGGKDSTYALCRLVEMGVKVLAFVFDNGYISEAAFKNIDRVVSECGVDCVIQTQEDMNKVFLAGLKEEYSVCKGCFKVLTTLSTRYAYENHIPIIINGLSRGQIFDVRLYDILKQGKINNVAEIEEKILEQRYLYHAKQDYVTQMLSKGMELERDVIEKTEIVDFYRYTDVTKEEIQDFLKSRSDYWRQPQDTGSCSSNCRVNDVGIYVQRKEKGYDNYTFPNSWEVRLGHIELEQSKRELEEEINHEKVAEIMKEIGYEENPVKEESKKNIIAYYVADTSIKENDVYEFLKERLAAYEVPSGIRQIGKIPMNRNGKVDYRALPKIGAMYRKKESAYLDEIEIKLAAIWSEILQTDQFDRTDNFLAIGGHSLKVMTMISMIYEQFEVDMPLETVFNDAVISKLAEYIRTHAGSAKEEIVRIPESASYKLSFQQIGLYMEEQLNSLATGNNNAMLIKINGRLEVKRLETALRKLVYRHEILRMSFGISGDEIVQYVHEQIPFDLSVVTEEDCDISTYIKPFDLTKAPLIRTTLFMNRQGTKLLIDYHHIAGDGLSAMIMVSELADLYADKPLDELAIQYKDFASWQFKQRTEMDLTEKRKYWQDVFEGFNPQKGKWDRHDPDEKDVYKGADKDLNIEDEALFNRLNQLAVKHKMTLFMVYLAAFGIVYSKYTASEDVVIGTPLHGREQEKLQKLIGTMTNGVPLRSYPSGAKTFAQYAEEIKGVLIGAINNQQYYLSEIVQDLTDSNYLLKSYLFDTVFTMFVLEEEVTKSDGIEFEYENDITTVETQKMRVIVRILPEKVRVKIKYAEDYLEEAMVSRMIEDYHAVLDMVSRNDMIKIADISLAAAVTVAADSSKTDVDFNF